MIYLATKVKLTNIIFYDRILVSSSQFGFQFPAWCGENNFPLCAGERKEREMADGKDGKQQWYVAPIGAVIDYTQPLQEQGVEFLLTKIVSEPRIRALFEWNRSVSTGILSAFIGAIPKPPRTTLTNRVICDIIDLAKTMPREIGRKLDELMATGTAAVAVRQFPGGAAGQAITDAIRFLEVELAPHFGAYTELMSALESRERLSLSRVVLSRPTVEIAQFFAFGGVEQREMLRFLTSQPAPHRSLRNAEADFRGTWTLCEFLVDEALRLQSEGNRLRPSDRARATRLEFESLAREDELSTLASTLPVLQGEILRLRREAGSNFGEWINEHTPRTQAALLNFAARLRGN